MKRFIQSKAFGPLLLLIAEYTTKIIGPFISIILVRYLGVDDYGIYSSAIAVTSFLTVLPDFGLQQTSLKLSTDKGIKLNELIKSSLYVSLLYTTITFVFLIGWLHLFKYENLIKIVAYILAISFLQLAFRRAMTTLMQIQRQYTRIAIWNVVINSLQWMTTLFCIYVQASLIILVLIPQLVILFMAMLMLVMEGNKIKLFSVLNPFKNHIDYKKIVVHSLEFGTANSMYQVYHRSDALILSASRNPTEVGFYNIAFRLAGFVYFFAGVLFNQVLYPLFFKWSKSDRERYLLYYRMLNKQMILLGFVAMVYITLFSNDLITIIFGYTENYAIILLKIMMFAVPFRFLVISTGAILTTDNLVRERIKIQSKIAVLNVGLNALLVPIYGGIVAAILMVITDILLMTGYILATNKNITTRHFSRRTYFTFPVLIILSLISLYFSYYGLIFRIVAGLVLIVPFITIFILALEKDELEEIKGLLGRKN